MSFPTTATRRASVRRTSRIASSSIWCCRTLRALCSLGCWHRRRSLEKCSPRGRAAPEWVTESSRRQQSHCAGADSVRWDRFPVVHRGDPDAPRRSGGQAVRDCLPGLRADLRRDALHRRGTDGWVAGAIRRHPAVSADNVQLVTAISTALLTTFSIRMAAVFTLVVTNLGRRTGIMPRWLVIIGFGVAAVLFLAPPRTLWATLLFPAWVFVFSVYMIVAAGGRSAWRGPRSGLAGEVRCSGGQGRGRTADLPIFSRTLVPTELPGRCRPFRGDVTRG